MLRAQVLKSWSVGGDSAEVIRFQMGSVGWSSGQLIFRGLLGMNINVGCQDMWPGCRNHCSYVLEGSPCL